MTLLWLRTSARILDNPLWTRAGVLNQQPQHVTVILTPSMEQYRDHGYGDRKLRLRQQQLTAFSQCLTQSGIQCETIDAPRYREAVEAVLKRSRALGVSEVWADREYGLNERRRDSWLGKQLNQHGIDFNLVDDRQTYPPEQVLNGQGQPYKIFTAYKKAWRRLWANQPVTPFARPEWATALPEPEEQAQQALNAYVDQALANYERDRNRLTQPVVSGLSPAIANGLLTTRQAFAATQHHAAEATDKWLDEWIWREFFYAVGFHFPQVYTHQALQSWTDAVAWSQNAAQLDAWKQGQTGYPIVDAAMRQLANTGQMPNRARMFTAAFLSKDLLLDWRLGEAWFLEQLVDADFAVNNGNWQWGASAGVDAAPYFRIFNPTRQAERFDPDGDYVRAWVPELAHLDAKALLAPSPIERQAAGYPEPLVIHKEAAARTKTKFSQAKQAAAEQQ